MFCQTKRLIMMYLNGVVCCVKKFFNETIYNKILDCVFSTIIVVIMLIIGLASFAHDVKPHIDKYDQQYLLNSPTCYLNKNIRYDKC